MAVHPLQLSRDLVVSTASESIKLLSKGGFQRSALAMALTNACRELGQASPQLRKLVLHATQGAGTTFERPATNVLALQQTFVGGGQNIRRDM